MHKTNSLHNFVNYFATEHKLHNLMSFIQKLTYLGNAPGNASDTTYSDHSPTFKYFMEKAHYAQLTSLDIPLTPNATLYNER